MAGAEQQGGDAEALLVGVRLFFDSLMMRGVVPADSIRLFLCGDVRTGRGIDQVLYECLVAY